MESLQGLGVTLDQLGHYDQAEDHLRRAIGLVELRGSPEPLRLADILGALAKVRLHLADRTEAETLYRRSLALRRDVLGYKHYQVAHDQAALGTVISESAPDEAERLMRKALAILDEILEGRDHPQLALLLSNLGLHLHRSGQSEEAEAMIRRGLEMERRLTDSDHPSIAASLSNLGIIASDQGRLEEADSLYQEAISIYEKTLGPSHYQFARVLHLIGVNAYEMRDYSAAEQNLRRSFDVLLQHLGSGHPNLAYPLVALSQVFLESGDASAALDAATLAAESLRGALPEDHWRIAEAECKRGASLMRLGRLDEAKPLLLETLAALEATFPETDRRVKSARDWLAELHRAN